MDAIRVLIDEAGHITPTRADCRYVSAIWTRDMCSYMAYYRTIRDLMLAGFCLLLLCSVSSGEDIFKPTGRYAVAETTSEPVSKQPQRYLVSEPWCGYCPAAKAKFISKGWPESNILTIAQCQARFGFKPSHVPFEFDEPEQPLSKTKQLPITMSHSEMVATHNRLHGGGSWTWPGDLATHLRTVHGVSTTSQPAQKPTVMRVQQTSSCPTGNCPVPQYNHRKLRRSKR